MITNAASTASGTSGLRWALVMLLTCTAGASAQPIRVPARFQPPGSLADLAEAVEPAVVSIQAATLEKGPATRPRDRTVDPFEFFFGPRQGPGAGAQPKPEAAQPPAAEAAPQQPEPEAPREEPESEVHRSDAGGSGFLISRDGLVVTNFHVIAGATKILVHRNGRDYPARVRGVDKETDLALLEIDSGGDLPYLELADSDAVRVGDWVMAIGNPLNLDHTMTTGVVSAKGRSIGISDTSFENFIQTDAAINFGNSGGPLVDMQGRVVAIATAINYGAENIGFAVPANTLRDILPQLRDKGRVSRGYLGVAINNLDFQQAQAFGLVDTSGALVGLVTAGSPAGKAGIEHGDVIVAVDGRKIAITRDLIQYVAAKSPGATVTLDLVRDGKTIQTQITLEERQPPTGPTPNDAGPADQPGGDEDGDWPGIQLEELTAAARKAAEIPPEVHGVLVAGVAPTSPLYEQAVRTGCVVSEVNGRAVATVKELEHALASAKSGAYLRLYVFIPDGEGQARPFFAVVQAP